MSDFVESAKNFVSAAVSRTSWEAQKQLRVRSKQSEIDKLLEQRHQLLDDLAQVAMNLYLQGALQNPQLSRLCASIMELDSDMKNRETQLQDAKNEAYPVQQFSPAPTTDYSPPAYPPPAGAPYAGAGPQRQGLGQVCPNCGSAIRPNALYCRNCGAKLR